MAWALKKIFAVGIVLSFLFCLLPSGGSQTPDNYVKASTDFELLGAQDLHGGGHLTYTLVGNAARDLRLQVLRIYDGQVASTPKNNRIDAVELKYSEGMGYIAAVEHTLEGTNFFAGGTISFDPLHEGQGEPITIDAEGFVGEDVWNSSAPVNIYLYFDAREFAGARTEELFSAEAVPSLFRALYQTLPSQWVGTYIYSHTDYRVGLVSVYNTRMAKGKIYVFRTPAGEISKYDVTFQSTAYPTRERFSYSSFDFLENPQVLFIIMFVCAYFTSAMPNKYWANYKLSHPRRYRHKAKKIGWIHILSKVLIIFMLLFYFVPNMLTIFGSSFFLGGIVIWIFGIVSAAAMTAVGKSYY